MFSILNNLGINQKVVIPLDDIQVDPIHLAFLEEVEIYQKIVMDTWQLQDEFNRLEELLQEEKDFILKVLLTEKDSDIKEIVRGLIQEIDSCDEETDSSYIIKRIQEFRIYYYDSINDDEIVSRVEDKLKQLIKVRREILRGK